LGMNGSMIRRLTTLLVGALFAVLPVAALAQLTPGTTLVGNMDQNLSSNHAQPGQPITISNAHTTNHDINGATIYGHVATVQAAGQGTPGKITLAFDKVNTRSGSVYQVSGYASNVDVQTKSNAGKELGAAAAGALVGGLIGHGVGAIIGAGAGGIYAKNNRQNINIQQGSVITVQIVRSRRQS
jgi:hypothetical protein